MTNPPAPVVSTSTQRQGTAGGNRVEQVREDDARRSRPDRSGLNEQYIEALFERDAGQDGHLLAGVTQPLKRYLFDEPANTVKVPAGFTSCK